MTPEDGLVIPVDACDEEGIIARIVARCWIFGGLEKQRGVDAACFDECPNEEIYQDEQSKSGEDRKASTPYSHTAG